MVKHFGLLMLQPHGRYDFCCLPKLPLVLETHLRREGVLSSNGFIYCIPEAAPTILRRQNTFNFLLVGFSILVVETIEQSVFICLGESFSC